MGAVATFVDITERKRMELALARTLQEKSDFLADVSHELRTPLTVIRGSAEVGLELDRNCVHREALEDIVKESTRVQRMVEDLLSRARIRVSYQWIWKRWMSLSSWRNWQDVRWLWLGGGELL